MFERIIRFAIEHRWLVLAAVLGMAAGIYSYQKLPIDAVPDITNVQVQINTAAPGYSPLETEQRITYPIETVMAGLPDRADPVAVALRPVANHRDFQGRHRYLFRASAGQSAHPEAKASCPIELNLPWAYLNRSWRNLFLDG